MCSVNTYWCPLKFPGHATDAMVYDCHTGLGVITIKLFVAAQRYYYNKYILLLFIIIIFFFSSTTTKLYRRH